MCLSGRKIAILKISLGIIINCVNCDNLLGVFLKKCFYETIIYTAAYH